MAITYAAGSGTIITSPIVYETLGSQSGAASDEVYLDTASGVPSGHTNYGGQVGDNSTGQGPGDTYVGRLVVLRPGTSTEEIKLCTGATGTSPLVLTVHEDWDTPPATDDYLAVSYTMDDIETGGAGGGVAYTSKTAEYVFSNKLSVGNATDFAMLTLSAAESMEINDSSGATDPDFEVFNNGMFCAGYLFGGTPVGGGYITSEQDADGEETWGTYSGSMVRLNATDIKISLNDLRVDFASGSDIIINTMKNYQFTYDCNLLDGEYYNVRWIGGSGGTNDYVRIAEETTIEGWVLYQTGGFHTADGDTSTESLTIRDVFFINNLKYISINSNKTWYVINPIWGATTYTDFTWLTSTSNYVYDQRSVDVVVQEADETKIQNANVIVYEGTVLDDLVLETYTDANGVASGVFTYKLHSTNSSTTTYGTHAFRVDCWSYVPFVASQSSTEYRSGVVVLNPDSNIQAASQAAALSDGSGITWNEDTNPSSIIEFTSGSGTLSVSDTVTASPSGATGVVTKIVDGDSSEGTVHLKTRNATAFANGDSLSNGGGWSGSYTSDSQQDFTIWIDGNNKTMQVIHDYLAALTSQTTLSATGELIHEWGKASQGRALYLGSSGFYTPRSGTEGIFITNFGAGTIAYFTDDDGGTWTPPTSVTLTVRCKNEAGENIEGIRVRIETLSGGTLIAEGETNSSGVFSSLYYYTIDVDVRVIARLKGYRSTSASSIIESSGLVVPFTMIKDPVVALP